MVRSQLYRSTPLFALVEFAILGYDRMHRCTHVSFQHHAWNFILSHPNQLEQFSASYDAMQDRLLLRVRTSDDAEFRFWLTRRFVDLLWPILMKIADSFSSRKAPSDPVARGIMAEMAHGEAVGGANFTSQYQKGSLFPLGEEPILLAKISVKAKEGNTQTLTLLPQEGQGLNLELDEKLVHVIARLLQEAANGADWGLKLQVTPGGGNAPDVNPSSGPRLLH